MVILSFSAKDILKLAYKNSLAPFPMVVSFSLISFQLHQSYAY